jgi:hypothetical protein
MSRRELDLLPKHNIRRPVIIPAGLSTGLSPSLNIAASSYQSCPGLHLDIIVHGEWIRYQLKTAHIHYQYHYSQSTRLLC